MTNILHDFWIYLLPLAIFWGIFTINRARQHRRSLAALNEAIETGMTEPASLHPVINPNRCLGCGSCIASCPEQSGHSVLGLIAGKSTLIGPSYCIGHGACAKACPQDAITLVFGTATRGIDIPEVKSNFESSVPGLFIAGELGGMGLIRNAIVQGCQALSAIRKLIASDFLRTGDISTAGLRFTDSGTARTYGVNLNSRLLFNQQLRVNPKLLVDYRQNTDRDGHRWRVRPALRLEYRWKKRYHLEFEGGTEWANEQVDGQSYKNRDDFFTLGYRIDF